MPERGEVKSGIQEQVVGMLYSGAESVLSP